MGLFCRVYSKMALENKFQVFLSWKFWALISFVCLNPLLVISQNPITFWSNYPFKQQNQSNIIQFWNDVFQNQEKYRSGIYKYQQQFVTKPPFSTHELIVGMSLRDEKRDLHLDYWSEGKMEESLEMISNLVWESLRPENYLFCEGASSFFEDWLCFKTMEIGSEPETCQQEWSDFLARFEVRFDLNKVDAILAQFHRLKKSGFPEQLLDLAKRSK